MSSVYIGITILLWTFSLKKYGCVGALSSLLFVSTVYSAQNSVDVVIKLLYLVTVLLQMKKKVRKNGTLFMFVFMVIFSFINAHYALYNRTFSQQDCLTANITFYTGFLVCLCTFSLGEVKKILRAISILPLVSLGLGVVLGAVGLVNFFGRFGTSIAGASLSTNLSFFGTIGVAAALVHFKCFGDVRFRYLAYFNFLVTCSTLTRGGILASAIILMYDVIPFLRFLLKRYKTIVLSMLGLAAVIPASVYAVFAIMARTSANGDSGRATAWAYILSLQRNQLWGNGYGFLKGRDDYELLAYSAAHNEYIHLYVEIGIIGLVLVALFYLITVKNIFRFSNVPKLLILEVVLAFLAYSYTDNTITNFRFWFPYMTLLSLLYNCRKEMFSLQECPNFHLRSVK